MPLRGDSRTKGSNTRAGLDDNVLTANREVKYRNHDEFAQSRPTATLPDRELPACTRYSRHWSVSQALGNSGSPSEPSTKEGTAPKKARHHLPGQPLRRTAPQVITQKFSSGHTHTTHGLLDPSERPDRTKRTPSKTSCNHHTRIQVSLPFTFLFYVVFIFVFILPPRHVRLITEPTRARLTLTTRH